jgi:Sec-independent protein translocase protein TatA
VNFSIGEILVVLLMALLVIKPERLPETAYTIGRFAQSIRRMLNKIKDEMNGLMACPEEAVERPSQRASSETATTGPSKGGPQLEKPNEQSCEQQQ